MSCQARSSNAIAVRAHSSESDEPYGRPGVRRRVCHRRQDEPTIFRDGPFRFFFFSLDEERLHVHVQSPDGEAKFWIEPEIETARSYRLSDQDLKRVLQLVVDHEQEIRDAWHRHFDR